METQMEWTSEYPTQQGYYWTRSRVWKSSPFSSPDDDVCIVQVVKEDGRGCLDFYDIGCELLWSQTELVSCEWFGPIPQP